MVYLDLSFRTPAENLACDEALLDSSESGDTGEVLRFWEAKSYFVVVGYANQVAREVNLAACKARGIPIYRRCTGGGAVVQGPGCLNYALILRIDTNKWLSTVTDANRFILERNRAAIAMLLSEKCGARSYPEPSVCGHTDLALGTLKFSGNAQRRCRRFLLFHGTFLLEFDLGLVEKLLLMPQRQPAYRENRSHTDFLTNLHLPADKVKSALLKAWNATAELQSPPYNRVSVLAAAKYSSDAWNYKF